MYFRFISKQPRYLFQKLNLRSFSNKKPNTLLNSIRDVFQNKKIKENQETSNPERKMEINYKELAKKIEHMAINNKEIAQQLMEIHQSIIKVQEESFKIDEVDKLIESGISYIE